MSKKTRKKSSKLAPGGKSGKAKAPKRAGAAVSAQSAPGKSGKKPAVKRRATKAAKGEKTPATASKRSLAKPASVKKAAASGTRSKTATVTAARALAEGNPAPAFSLLRDGGQLVSLGSYAGRKLVIFFYPRADTPGCTLEAIAFSRLADAFAAVQTAVLGVSADSVTAQESFRDKHELTVPLLSDQALGMLKAYGVWGKKSMYGKTFMGISRTTVLLDSSGNVAKIWRNVRVDGHADEVLSAAQAI